ncbi:tRNA lysidine(34) synthetase TilS [Micrococcus lylae]|nr:tRNA lysidine(34) synthetase TilS [Micrococcus lylae]
MNAMDGGGEVDRRTAGVPVGDGGAAGRGAEPPALGAWPPPTRWPDAVHRGVAALKGVLQGQRPALLAVSGGADSLALAVLAAVLIGTREGAGLRIGAAVVDHGLQPGSAAVAAAAAQVCRRLGMEPTCVETVRVEDDGDGPEAAARAARMTALAEAARRTGAGLVVTAHTADDQAEQVLLALARGSGTRSLAGMPARRRLLPPTQAGGAEGAGTTGGSDDGRVELVRPLLGLTRADTEAICAWAGATWWTDPMNAELDIRRVRVREHLLPLLEDEERGLGAGVRAGLVRSAAIAAEDAAALEAWAGRELARLRRDVEDTAVTASPRPLALDLDGLAALPAAVRHRIYARAATLTGAEPTTRERLLAVDALVTQARRGGTSAGPVQLGGGTRVRRRRREAAGGGERPGAGARTCARLEFHPDPAVD